MRTFLISLAAGAVMSAITAAAILLTTGTSAEVAAPAGEVGATAQPVAATAAEVRDVASLPPEPTAEDAAAPAAFDPAGIYERVAPAVLTIASETGNGGSGFFVDDEGHILTNHHVVEGARRIVARTWAGERVEAELIGSDPANDLAVIKVDPDEATITLLEYADLSAARVGDPVAAIGTPHGFSHSLSTGIISGLERVVQSTTFGGRSHFGVLQTDAALNPGNSGGVLVDRTGALLGAPFRIESPIRAFTGVGLVIPVDTIQRVLPRMIAGEHISHPRLGVSLEDDLEITRVVEGSAAERAGLRAGDALQKIGGIRIGDLGDLIAALETLRVGETASVQFVRDGVIRVRRIDLEAWPQLEVSSGLPGG